MTKYLTVRFYEDPYEGPDITLLAAETLAEAEAEVLEVYHAVHPITADPKAVLNEDCEIPYVFFMQNSR